MLMDAGLQRVLVLCAKKELILSFILQIWEILEQF
jgi:hypothetical protein